MTRRRSVASISPHASPSQQSPPTKKPIHSFQPSFTIQIPQQQNINDENATLNDDFLFLGLESAVIKSWTKFHPDVLSATFEKRSWQTHFERLGVDQDVISMISTRLSVLEEIFSEAVVWTVFSTETVGTVAQWTLKTEVAEYSYKRLRYTHQTGESSDTDDSHPSRPCPSPTRGGAVDSSDAVG